MRNKVNTNRFAREFLIAIICQTISLEMVQILPCASIILSNVEIKKSSLVLPNMIPNLILQCGFAFMESEIRNLEDISNKTKVEF